MSKMLVAYANEIDFCLQLNHKIFHEVHIKLVKHIYNIHVTLFYNFELKVH
jgi:hypothetical protein